MVCASRTWASLFLGQDSFHNSPFLLLLSYSMRRKVHLYPSIHSFLFLPSLPLSLPVAHFTFFLHLETFLPGALYRNSGKSANSDDIPWKLHRNPNTRIMMDFCGFFQGRSSEFAWIAGIPYTMHPVKNLQSCISIAYSIFPLCLSFHLSISQSS